MERISKIINKPTFPSWFNEINNGGSDETAVDPNSLEQAQLADPLQDISSGNTRRRNVLNFTLSNMLHPNVYNSNCYASNVNSNINISFNIVNSSVNRSSMSPNFTDNDELNSNIGDSNISEPHSQLSSSPLYANSNISHNNEISSNINSNVNISGVISVLYFGNSFNVINFHNAL